jgi:hypothetical protein
MAPFKKLAAKVFELNIRCKTLVDAARGVTYTVPVAQSAE